MYLLYYLGVFLYFCIYIEKIQYVLLFFSMSIKYICPGYISLTNSQNQLNKICQLKNESWISSVVLNVLPRRLEYVKECSPEWQIRAFVMNFTAIIMDNLINKSCNCQLNRLKCTSTPRHFQCHKIKKNILIALM